jgi:hypothetical protein
MDNTLRFSTNWNNKLQCDTFTTLRLDSDKYKVGEVYKVTLKGHLKDIRIIDKKVLLLNQINDWIAFIDTGYNRDECINIIKRMYAKHDIDWNTKKLQLLLCKTVK